MLITPCSEAICSFSELCMQNELVSYPLKEVVAAESVLMCSLLVLVLLFLAIHLLCFTPCPVLLLLLQFPVCSLQAIMVFSKRHSFMASSQRPAKTRLHWILQLSSLLCAAGGLAVIMYNKELNNKEHFTTRHGLFGFLACIMTLVQCTGE